MRDRATTISRWPPTRRLWTLVGGVALVEALLTFASRSTVERGQDFMAFYGAGRLAAAGRAAAMYDLDVLGVAQRTAADAVGFAMAKPVAPWLNPPQFALPFAPLALLDFRTALLVWTLFSIACLAASAWLLMRMIGERSPLRRHRWLVAAAVAVAPPTLQSLGHGQNAPLSLLLLTLTVAAWRAGRPIAAGVACALLAYKPQLAAVIGVALVASLGWRSLVGLGACGAIQLVATALLLPGAIAAFLARSAGNVQRVFFDVGFAWHRHVTILGFLRHTLQGNGPGRTHGWIAALAGVGMLGVAAMLVVAWRRRVAHDSFIALAVLAIPLVVPYLVDYDLLILAVAGTLIAREQLESRDDSSAARWLRRSAMVTFAWLLVNPIFAELAGVGLTTPLLVAMFALQARRCLRREIAIAPSLSIAPEVRRAA